MNILLNELLFLKVYNMYMLYKLLVCQKLINCDSLFKRKRSHDDILRVK